MAEIDDNELAQLRVAAEFVKKVADSEGGTTQIEKWAKKLNPKIRTSQDVAEEHAKPILDEMGTLKKRLDDWDSRISDYNQSESLNKVKKEYGFTDAGMEDLKKFMKDNDVKNPRIAAAAWEKQNPARPVTPSYISNDFTVGDILGEQNSKSEDLKRLSENPMRWQDDEARKFFAEKEQRKNNDDWAS